MARNDYHIACRIEAPGDPNHGLWHVLNARTGRRAAGEAGGPFDTMREARDSADAQNGAAFMDGQGCAPSDVDAALEAVAAAGAFPRRVA